MGWLFMICGLAVTLLSLATDLSIPWLVAAIVLVAVSVVLLIQVPFELTIGLETR